MNLVKDTSIFGNLDIVDASLSITGNLFLNGNPIVNTIILDEDVPISGVGVSRRNVNYFGFSLQDDALQDEVEITHNFGDESNVDISGIAAGDMIKRNVSNTGFDVIQPKYFEELERIVIPNITSDGSLPFFIKAGYAIDSIVIEEIGEGSVSGLNMGLSSGTDEIISNFDILQNDQEMVPLGKQFFNIYNNTNIYISGTWNSANLTIYILTKKII